MQKSQVTVKQTFPSLPPAIQNPMGEVLHIRSEQRMITLPLRKQKAAALAWLSHSTLHISTQSALQRQHTHPHFTDKQLQLWRHSVMS